MKETLGPIKLEQLSNSTRPYKRRKLLGRGPGSGSGKTSGRGVKGAGSRSGYRVRAGKEGGGVPLFRRVPTRGFSNARFAKKLDCINLDKIDALYKEGEVVSLETLIEKGCFSARSHGVKVLGKGSLTKKLNFQVESFSASAKKKLQIE